MSWGRSFPTITSYLAELHSQLFASLSMTVAATAPERTFWEKATILRQEANRPEGKAMPRRYARRCYDMYELGHSGVAERAIAQPDLLAKVVAFKERRHLLGNQRRKVFRITLGNIRIGRVHCKLAPRSPKMGNGQAESPA